MARLKEIYRKEVVPALVQQFGYKSTMQVPRLTKIVLNMGVGEAVADKKILENAVGDMTRLSGQKPVITKAKKSIAVWKIRTGYPIGCMVTLRQDRMYEFLDRLVSIALAADRAACTASSGSGATSCARSRCVARSRASSRRAGRRDHVRSDRCPHP